MSAIMVILLFLFLIEARIAKPGEFFEDYCSREKSNALKGIFVMMVFTSHFRTYISVGESDMLAVNVADYLGQLMVTPFLFYSGYGVAESIRKKGLPYVKKLPVQRALKTLVHFDLAVCLYLLLTLAMGNRVTIRDVLLSMVCWVSFGNSTWYIFAIVCLYLITAVSFLLIRKNPYLATALATALTLVLILVLSQVREAHWHNTMLCYVLGLWYPLIRKRVEKLVMRSDLIYCTALLAAFCAFIKIRGMSFPWAYHLLAAAFVVILVGVSMKLSLDNPFLQFLGKHTFGIYILQRLPMLALSHWGIAQKDSVVLYILCFMLTCILAMLFEKATSFVDAHLFARAQSKV